MSEQPIDELEEARRNVILALMTIKARAATVIDEWKTQPDGQEAWFTQNAYAVADDALRAYDKASSKVVT